MKDKDRVIEILKNNGVAHYWDIDKIASQICELDSEYTPYQLCPKCNGDGDLARYNSPALHSGTPICDVCNGGKIIPMHKNDSEWVSDEEIEKESEEWFPYVSDEPDIEDKYVRRRRADFQLGAEWMRDKLTKQ